MLSKRKKSAADSIAESWRSFIQGYQALSIEELEYLLEEEKARTLPRRSFLLRLHQRVSNLKIAEERKEILK